MMEPYFTKVAEYHHSVLQCIFKKISEHAFYRTTVNYYLGTNKVRFKYWSSIVSFESGITSEKTKVQILGIYHFRGLYLKNIFDQEKATKI